MLSYFHFPAVFFEFTMNYIANTMVCERSGACRKWPGNDYFLFLSNQGLWAAKQNCQGSVSKPVVENDSSHCVNCETPQHSMLWKVRVYMGAE